MRTDEATAAVNRQNLKALFDAGVALGFGTDSGATPLRVPGFAEHHELQLLVAVGLQPIAALRIATSQTAELLALQDRGVLAAGKLADFSVVQGDPSRRIEDLAKIEQVWHRGRKVRGPIDTFATMTLMHVSVACGPTAACRASYDVCRSCPSGCRTCFNARDRLRTARHLAAWRPFLVPNALEPSCV
jgi:hypothetical protein